MENMKIKRNMKFLEMMKVMSDDDPGALSVLKQMIYYLSMFKLDDILLLDSLGIRGSKIWVLYSDCCNENIYKFKRTLMILKDGVYSEEEIQGNLELSHAIPFLDEALDMNYDEKIGPNDKDWSEYVKANRNLVAPKIYREMASQNKSRK